MAQEAVVGLVPSFNHHPEDARPRRRRSSRWGSWVNMAIAVIATARG
jgi:hypothetical protein